MVITDRSFYIEYCSRFLIRTHFIMNLPAKGQDIKELVLLKTNSLKNSSDSNILIIANQREMDPLLASNLHDF